MTTETTTDDSQQAEHIPPVTCDPSFPSPPVEKNPVEGDSEMNVVATDHQEGNMTEKGEEVPSLVSEQPAVAESSMEAAPTAAAVEKGSTTGEPLDVSATIPEATGPARPRTTKSTKRPIVSNNNNNQQHPPQKSQPPRPRRPSTSSCPSTPKKRPIRTDSGGPSPRRPAASGNHPQPRRPRSASSHNNNRRTTDKPGEPPKDSSTRQMRTGQRRPSTSSCPSTPKKRPTGAEPRPAGASSHNKRSLVPAGERKPGQQHDKERPESSTRSTRTAGNESSTRRMRASGAPGQPRPSSSSKPRGPPRTGAPPPAGTRTKIVGGTKVAVKSRQRRSSSAAPPRKRQGPPPRSNSVGAANYRSLQTTPTARPKPKLLQPAPPRPPASNSEQVEMVDAPTATITAKEQERIDRRNQIAKEALMMALQKKRAAAAKVKMDGESDSTNQAGDGDVSTDNHRQLQAANAELATIQPVSADGATKTTADADAKPKEKKKKKKKKSDKAALTEETSNHDTEVSTTNKVENKSPTESNTSAETGDDGVVKQKKSKKKKAQQDAYDGAGDKDQATKPKKKKDKSKRKQKKLKEDTATGNNEEDKKMPAATATANNDTAVVKCAVMVRGSPTPLVASHSEMPTMEGTTLPFASFPPTGAASLHSSLTFPENPTPNDTELLQLLPTPPTPPVFDREEEIRNLLNKSPPATKQPIDLLDDSPPTPTSTTAAGTGALHFDQDPIQDPQYQPLTVTKTWLQRNKRWMLALIILLMLVGVLALINTIIFGWEHPFQVARGPMHSAVGYDEPNVELNTSSATTFRPTATAVPLPIVLPAFTQEALKDPTSPQFQASFWLAQDPRLQEYPEWQLLQRYAVATLVFALRPRSPVHRNMQTDHYRSDNWLDYDGSECDWMPGQYSLNAVNAESGEGPSTPSSLSICNADGHYQRLEMTGISGFPSGLNISIPQEISLLSTLEQVHLANNGLFSTLFDLLPAEFWDPNNTSLRLRVLDLSYNNIYASIPSSFFEGSCQAHLESLDLSFNKLTGSIPQDIQKMKKLLSLRLTKNGLRGSIPTELFQLTQMQDLGLSGNELTGRIPADISKTELTSLQLSENALTGGLPSEIGLLSLVSLDVSSNSMNSFIPSEIGLLGPTLTSLDLSSNAWSGPLPTDLTLLSNLKRFSLSVSSITGTLPVELSLMTSLENLDISNTLIRGPLPVEMFVSLTNLKELTLSGNTLNGKLHSEIGLLGQSLTWLDLSSNDLTGRVPSEVAALQHITGLVVARNTLTGPIPVPVGALGSLSYFDASNNYFEGPIPEELFSAPLRVLQLNQNYLSGEIKSEIGVLHATLKELDISRSALASKIPSEIGRLTKLEVLRLSLTAITGSLPSEMNMMTSLRILELHGTPLTGTMPAGLCFLPSLERLTANCTNIICDCNCICQ